MRNTRYRLWVIILLVLLCGTALFLWYVKREPVILPSPPVSYGTTTPLLSPQMITIPKIGVQTDIQHVGLAKNGNMAVPTNYTDVGWYRLGAAPGEKGNAVIAGHLDTGFGRPAVFSHLEELAPGDQIIIHDDSGKAVHFIIERLATYDYTDAPLEEIFGPSDDVRLNLITCDGVWDPDSKTYSKRLVVFAKAAVLQQEQ